jgi:phenylacetate-CoA ligase
VHPQAPRYYWQGIDWSSLMRDYPPPPVFETTTGRMSADEVRSMQNERFLARMEDAWETPFYRERWSAAGLEPGDIRGLDDIDRIPTFSSSDLKDAIESAPPFGSHQPVTRDDFASRMIRILTSGGTTGLPRITLFDQETLEIQGIQTARALWAQGLRAGDVFQITYTNSLANAAWCAYQGAFHWLGAVPLTTGSGVVTPSEKQLEIASAWGTRAWWTRGEYLARLARTAEETGFDLHSLNTGQLHTHIGSDIEGHLRAELEQAWNAPVYDNYGTHEIGSIAFECREKDRKHVSEDTVYLEVVDIDTGEPRPAGVRGNLVATSLYRRLPPIIRYNLHDILILYDREPCACGLHTRKLSTFLGRSDEMVKLRGTNIYPLACQSVVTRDARTTGEYLCVVSNEGEGLSRRETFVVRIERRSRDIDAARLQQDMVAELHKVLGVRVDVEIAEPGGLSEQTGLGIQNKVRRLLDLRQ